MSTKMSDNTKKWLSTFQSISSDWDDYYQNSNYDAYAKQVRMRYALDLATRHVPSGGKALDLGCGTGQLSCLLAEAGFEVVGVDFSDKMIAIAHRNAEQSGVSEQCRFLLGEIENVHLDPAEFDLIVALGYLEYILKPEPVLQEIHRLAKKSGVFIGQIWNRWRITQAVNLKSGPLRFYNPHVIGAKILKLLKSLSAEKNEKAGVSTSTLIQPKRKWYSPPMLDRYMTAAGFGKIGYIGHLFAGIRYGNRLLIRDEIAKNIEERLMQITQKGSFKKLQLFGENYIAAYRKHE